MCIRDRWVAWANYNKFTGNTNNVDYSSLVFGMNGKWPTLGNDVLNDGMCIIDAKSGSTSEGAAQCVVTDKSAIPATKTYHCTSAQWTAFLTATINDAGFAATDGTETDFVAAMVTAACTE